ETPVELLRHYLDVAHRLKRQYQSARRNDPVLAGKTLAMIFEKPSLRTRVSFAVAMAHLGGSGMVLRPDEVGLGIREPVQDVARLRPLVAGRGRRDVPRAGHGLRDRPRPGRGRPRRRRRIYGHVGEYGPGGGEGAAAEGLRRRPRGGEVDGRRPEARGGAALP